MQLRHFSQVLTKGFDIAQGLRRVEELGRSRRGKVLASPLKPAIGNPEAPIEKAEHEARPFFLFLINTGDFCAPKGP